MVQIVMFNTNKENTMINMKQYVNDKMKEVVNGLDNNTITKHDATNWVKRYWKYIKPQLHVKITPKELVNEWYTERYRGE